MIVEIWTNSEAASTAKINAVHVSVDSSGQVYPDRSQVYSAGRKRFTRANRGSRQWTDTEQGLTHRKAYPLLLQT